MRDVRKETKEDKEVGEQIGRKEQSIRIK